jgi:hypothetical protein
MLTAKLANQARAKIVPFLVQAKAETAASSGSWARSGLRIKVNDRAPSPKKMVKTHRGKVKLSVHRPGFPVKPNCLYNSSTSQILHLGFISSTR